MESKCSNIIQILFITKKIKLGYVCTICYWFKMKSKSIILGNVCIIDMGFRGFSDSLEAMRQFVLV